MEKAMDGGKEERRGRRERGWKMREYEKIGDWRGGRGKGGWKNSGAKQAWFQAKDLLRTFQHI